MENKTYEEVWEEIEKALESTGFTIFNITKVCLPSEYYKIFKEGFFDGESIKWCGKPVVETDVRIIYFILVEQVKK